MSGAGVREASAAEVKSWVDSGEALLIDVRDPEEHARERIVPSTSIPMSRFDAASLPRTGKVVFHCVAGPRSMEAAARASAYGLDKVFALKGGIKAWKAAGLPTERTRGVPISIMRQVQIIAGSIVLISSILAVTVSVYFAFLAAFIGAGLVFAGSTGFCGMAAMLRMLPWNAAARGGCTK